LVFSSHTFLYAFLPAFLVLYALTPRHLKSLTITLGSYVFYGWARPIWAVLMLGSTLLDYGAGILIGRDQARGKSGARWLVISITGQLALLGWFKYANFGAETLNQILGATGNEPFAWEHVVLPVGISFYTFQTMSYTIDVYRKVVPPARNLVDFMCFVSMFPQLVAGPIVRYRDLADQIHVRSHTFDKFFEGVVAFEIGLAKKVLIADLLAPIVNQSLGPTLVSAGDPAWTGITQAGPLEAWIGAVAYVFQVYFDFSGYSDMAIGLGLMLGFRFPINFDQPLRAISITDFWRRWHISLSTWLRDYLYIPLGGNQRGEARTYVNLFLTMLLGGLWHGASWNCVLWGAYNGVLLCLERLSGKRAIYAFLPRSLQIAITFLLVTLGLVWFRSPGLEAAIHYLATMFGLANVGMTGVDFRPIHWIAFAVAAIVVWGFPVSQSLYARWRPAVAIAMQPCFLLALVHLHYQLDVPFLYYQF
jgi:alginate O-acetyltransferase complex protein AlgI